MNTDKMASIQSLPTWQAWILATRPKTLTAACVPIMVGTVLAYTNVVALEWHLVVFALMGAIMIQIGTNLINDALDFKKGADTEKRIGPMRVTQTGLLTARQVLGVGFACFAIATVCAVPLIYSGGTPILAILFISVLCGYLYTGGPFPLAYVGMGDIFVFLFFGVVATTTMYYLLTGEVNTDSIVAGAQIGMLATAMIAINNLRDREQDRKVGKNTLAVRLGVKTSRVEILMMTILPFALNGYWIRDGLYVSGLLPMAAFPLAVWLGVRISLTPPSKEYNKYLGISALLHLLFGILLTIGLCVA